MERNVSPQCPATSLRSLQGSMLVELMVALGLLITIGMFLLVGSLDLMKPRNWIIRQNVTDAYLTFEEAYAKRVPFDQITASDSDWPLFPDKANSKILLGKAPGGRDIQGTIIRTRIPSDNNLVEHKGSGTLATNPAEMETWKLQSVLSFNIGDKEYYKSRTVIRTR